VTEAALGSARPTPRLRPRRTLEAQERRFALGLLGPALVLLLLTTTAPLVYLVWNSLHKLDLSMPWLSGFAGVANYIKMGSDPRFWNSLALTGIYNRVDGRAAGRRRPVACAARAADSERPGRAARRRDPADRAGPGRRRPVSGARWCWHPTSASSTW
jgi:hypothetical protein